MPEPFDANGASREMDVVQRARAALDDITPGRWETYEYDVGGTELGVAVDGRGFSYIPITGSIEVDYEGCEACSEEGEQCFDCRAGAQARRNTEFIADAPTLVRELVAEVEKLRAQPVELSASTLAAATAAWSENERLEGDAIRFLDERNQAHAEVEKLVEWQRLHRGDLASERAIQGELIEARDAADVEADELRAERDELAATIQRVQEANELIHAHRFDLDRRSPAGRDEHDAWLSALGETRAPGPDIFYNGIKYAHKRILRALDGEVE